MDRRKNVNLPLSGSGRLSIIFLHKATRFLLFMIYLLS
jgi:hypothetical protein